MCSEKWLTVPDAVGKIRHVSNRQIQRWAAAGRIPGAFRTPGGRWRIPAAWVEEMVGGGVNGVC